MQPSTLCALTTLLVAAPRLCLSQARAPAIRGVVVDSNTSVPIQAAEVVVIVAARRLRAVTTDNDGRFSLEVPASGGFQIRAQSIGYAPLSVSFELIPESTYRLTLRLPQRPFEVSHDPWVTAREPCFQANRDTGVVSGTLVELTFPGRPNYEDIRRGDEPEVGLYIRLKEPICVATDNAADTVRAVQEVQLVLDARTRSTLRPLIGTTITLRGTLSGAHTAHHHAPVLLTPVAPSARPRRRGRT